MGSRSIAYRRPRPCGLTVHPVVGCPFKCSYCYLPELGVGWKPRVLEISGNKLVENILANRYFVKGGYGTFLAFGSLGEPFLPGPATTKTLEFMSAVKKRLGNPIQVSTKAVVPISDVLKGVSVLITVVTIKRWKEIEPHSTPPYIRMENFRRVNSVGGVPALFVRPIIPGVTDVEIYDILKVAYKHGCRYAVFGGFRVTRNIIGRLARAGVDVSRIKDRIRGRLDDRQRYIIGYDLKVEAMQLAKEVGIVPLSSACCATALAYGIACTDPVWVWEKCTGCPNNCKEKIPDEDSVLKFLASLGIHGRVYDNKVLLDKIEYRRLKEWTKVKIQTFSRRFVVIG